MTETPVTPVTQHPAAEFDVQAWLQDAKMPEESADVYKRADVIGEISELRRRIAILRKAAAVEKSAGEESGGELAELEAQHDRLAEEFASSQLTIYVRALGPDERKEVREAHAKRTDGLPEDEANRSFGYDLLSKSIIAVRPYGGERVGVTWSPEVIRGMENSIGGTQMSLVLDAHRVAQNKVPEVDADFLHRPSGEGTGLE